MQTFRMVTAICVLLFATACSAVTDPGRFTFEGEGGGGCPTRDASDLGIELRRFEAHADELIEFRVVEDGGGLVLRGILEGLDEEGSLESDIDDAALLCLTFPEVVEQYGALTVRTFIDLNTDGVYDPLTEPGWQDPVVDGVAMVEGDATETGFDVAPAPPGNFELTVTGMAPHVAGTQHVAAMVIDAVDGVPVGYLRIADLDDPDFTIFIQEILQPDRNYILEFYADFTQDGEFTPLTEGEFDHAWLRPYRSDGDGDIVESFAHIAEFEELSYF